MAQYSDISNLEKSFEDGSVPAQTVRSWTQELKLTEKKDVSQCSDSVMPYFIFVQCSGFYLAENLYLVK